jgi:hypothetical protein
MASLVPAAAVTPAPIAYIKVAAVKKLVVGFPFWRGGPLPAVTALPGTSGRFLSMTLTGRPERPARLL